MPPKRKASASASSVSAPAPSTRPKRAAASKANAKNAYTANNDKDEEEQDSDSPPTKKQKVDSSGDDKAEDKKMVTVLRRGAVPVDPLSGYVQTHQVLVGDGEIWDAMLNQTNVNHNNNKFYVIQLLHVLGQPTQVWLFTRWGRVGDNGQKQLKGPFSVPAGIAAFKSQFKTKAGTAWEARHNMSAKSGKYVWIERDYDDDKEEKEEKKKDGDGEAEESEKEPDCTLKPEVMTLCQIIFSSKLLDAALSSMNYDAKKAPLGKLSKATILRGFETLKKLAEVLDDPNCALAQQYGNQQSACSELTNAYYSVIPHDFGRRRPLPIGSKEHLKKELELVDALGDMEVASKLISTTHHTDADGNKINQYDFYFNSLDLLSMDPVDQESKEFEALKRYTHGTHGKTHHFNCRVTAAFRVERRGEDERWRKGSYHEVKAGDRLLLWHGSRATNFAGILKQGLRIAPPEAPVSGYMFGKGVYFADMMSKSAGYTCHYLSNGTALLLLCEVAAKPYHEMKMADYNAEQVCRSHSKLATKGLGRTAPVEWQDAGEALDYDDLKGCYMPKGGSEDIAVDGASLQYNEYIVYNVDQIRLRYLIQLQMG